MEPRPVKKRRLLPGPETACHDVAQSQPQLHGQQLREAAEEDALDMELPSDVLAALMFLRNDLFGAQQSLLPPLLLKPHIYTVLADRTDVDRDLDELQRKGSVRLFKLTSGVDEYGIMLGNDYRDLVHKLIQVAETAQSQQPEPQQHHNSSNGSGSRANCPGQTASPAYGLRAFMQNVLPACPDVKVQGSLLMQLLSGPVTPTRPGSGSLSSGPGRPSSAAGGAADAAVSQLLAAGLLQRDAISNDAYLFTMPKAGLVVKALVSGRRELTTLLSKRRYNEAPEKELLTKQKLRGSSLSMKYHIRDLIGKGIAQRVTTPTGPFIKLIKR